MTKNFANAVGGDVTYQALHQIQDNTEMFSKVTERNEFIASGVEVAYDYYEIGSNKKTRVDGKLITNTLTGDGILFGDGIIEEYG